MTSFPRQDTAMASEPDFSSLAGVRVLVTGGAGFIGSHLATALANPGSEVIVLDDLAGGGDPANLPPSVRFVRGSILDLPLVERCVAGCSFVFHQAALGSVPRSVQHPRLFHDVNVTGTFNVLEASRAAGVKRLMFAASSSAYGDTPTLPKIETMPPMPRSPYAANKVAAEAMIRAYAASYGMDGVSLRYFNIFGPRQSADNAYAAVIAAFAKAILSDKRPVIFGDGEQSRDFTYVDNVVRANLLAATAEKSLNGAVINIACGQRVTVTELATEMAALLGRPDLKPEYREERAGDVKHSLADLSAAADTLGYHPVSSFKAGLAVTTEWYRGRFGKL
jgi:nucleoside-diphosphate-sugar epimerase